MWDFFLAHASADRGTAERLRSLLETEATVFEDSMLHAGEDWDVALDRHLRASAITVVLVSARTEASQYRREEITRAIALARGDLRRRVVPLLLDDVEPAALPYGLAVKPACDCPTDWTWPVRHAYCWRRRGIPERHIGQDRGSSGGDRGSAVGAGPGSTARGARSGRPGPTSGRAASTRRCCRRDRCRPWRYRAAGPPAPAWSRLPGGAAFTTGPRQGLCRSRATSSA